MKDGRELPGATRQKIIKNLRRFNTMKLKPVVASVIALGLAGSAVAAHTSKSMSPMMNKMMSVQMMMNGNSNMNMVPSMNWNNRIKVGGMLNVDAYNVDIATHLNDTNDASDNGLRINNANLYFDAMINPMVNAHVGLLYTGDNLGLNADNAVTPQQGKLSVDEAYVTIADMAKSPFYGKVGDFFTQYGDYSSPYPMLVSYAQALTQTKSTAAEVGFMSNGFFGNVSALSNGQSSYNTDKQTQRVRNYVAKVGYAGMMNGVSYKADASFIKDVRDVTVVSDAINDALLTSNRSSAYALHAMVGYGPFSVESHYTALDSELTTNDKNSRPAIFDLAAGYSFKTMMMPSTVKVMYETANKASSVSDDLGLDKYRYTASYGVNVMKNTMLTGLFAHAKDFKTNSDATYNVYMVRLGVKF